MIKRGTAVCLLSGVGALIVWPVTDAFVLPDEQAFLGDAVLDPPSVWARCLSTLIRISSQHGVCWAVPPLLAAASVVSLLMAGRVFAVRDGTNSLLVAWLLVVTPSFWEVHHGLFVSFPIVTGGALLIAGVQRMKSHGVSALLFVVLGAFMTALGVGCLPAILVVLPTLSQFFRRPLLSQAVFLAACVVLASEYGADLNELEANVGLMAPWLPLIVIYIVRAGDDELSDPGPRGLLLTWLPFAIVAGGSIPDATGVAMFPVALALRWRVSQNEFHVRPTITVGLALVTLAVALTRRVHSLEAITLSAVTLLPLLPKRRNDALLWVTAALMSISALIHLAPRFESARSVASVATHQPLVLGDEVGLPWYPRVSVAQLVHGPCVSFDFPSVLFPKIRRIMPDVHLLSPRGSLLASAARCVPNGATDLTPPTTVGAQVGAHAVWEEGLQLIGTRIDKEHRRIDLIMTAHTPNMLKDVWLSVVACGKFFNGRRPAAPVTPGKTQVLTFEVPFSLARCRPTIAVAVHSAAGRAKLLEASSRHPEDETRFLVLEN